jgi:hypothetical protein
VRQQIDWDWYGTWVIDYLTYDRDSLSDEAWGAYDIWRTAYINANPDLEEASDLELIENHYCQSMKPILDSFVMKIWLFLHWLPPNVVRPLIFAIQQILGIGDRYE